MEPLPWNLALERYTQLVTREVLRVQVDQAGEPDIVLIFRGMSSSLVWPTPIDQSQPVISEGARFISLDRLQGPFDPAHPIVIAVDLDVAATQALLNSVGLDPVGLDGSGSG